MSRDQPATVDDHPAPADDHPAPAEHFQFSAARPVAYEGSRVVQIPDRNKTRKTGNVLIWDLHLEILKPDCSLCSGS